jgi:SAM-dependent methyltransferase
MYLDVLKWAREWCDLELSYLKESMREAAPYASGRLLDVGCGDKPYQEVFRKYVDDYVGAEWDETYTSSANARKGKADVVYSGDRLPFDDGAFDTVLSNQVGEHVADPKAFFRELVRVLRPGGKLIYTVPFSYRIHFEPHDFHRFTRYALLDYAKKNGLEVDVLSPRGAFWSVVGQKLSTHMALRYARLSGEIQKLGGFGYEPKLTRGPRYWALPVVAPAIVGVIAACRVLDRIDRDESDTIGYMLIATKKTPAGAK